MRLFLMCGVAEHIAQHKYQHAEKSQGRLHQAHEEADEAHAVDDAGEQAADAGIQRVLTAASLAGTAGVDMQPCAEEGGTGGCGRVDVVPHVPAVNATVDKSSGIVSKVQQKQQHYQAGDVVENNARRGAESFFCSQQRFADSLAADEVCRQGAEEDNGEQ